MVLRALSTDSEIVLGIILPGFEIVVVVLLTDIYILSTFLGPHWSRLLALRKTQAST
jgi:hypothetical protein